MKRLKGDGHPQKVILIFQKLILTKLSLGVEPEKNASNQIGVIYQIIELL